MSIKVTQRGMDAYHKYRPFYGRDTATILMALVDNKSAMSLPELASYLSMTNSRVAKGLSVLAEGELVKEIFHNEESLYKFTGG